MIKKLLFFLLVVCSITLFSRNSTKVKQLVSKSSIEDYASTVFSMNLQNEKNVTEEMLGATGKMHYTTAFTTATLLATALNPYCNPQLHHYLLSKRAIDKLRKR